MYTKKFLGRALDFFFILRVSPSRLFLLYSFSSIHLAFLLHAYTVLPNVLDKLRLREKTARIRNLSSYV